MMKDNIKLLKLPLSKTVGHSDVTDCEPRGALLRQMCYQYLLTDRSYVLFAAS